MQPMLVVLALVLYAAFSSNPILELPILQKTLNMSPGDMFTIFLTFGMCVKVLVQPENSIIAFRPPAVLRFLYAYLFLAVVFLAGTLLFFLGHNELVPYFGRSVFNFLLWGIAPVLFFYGSGSSLEAKDLPYICRLLMGSFCLGVLGNIFINTSGVDLLKLVTDTLKSDQIRLGGQVGDPNQLGALAAFFSTIGIMGVIHERQLGAKASYVVLTAGTGLVLLLTQSRESMLALFIATSCIAILLLRTRQYRKACVVLLVLCLGSALILTNVPRVVETLSAMAVGDTGYALSSRGQVWRSALQAISTHPMGIGFENMYLISNNTVEQAHNSFLQAALIAGFAGFLAFLWFIICLIKLLSEERNPGSDNWLREAYLVFLFGYLVTALWSDHFIAFYTFNAIFFGFLGLVAAAYQEK